jgi:serine/threonine-protein kinase RsbW
MDAVRVSVPARPEFVHVLRGVVGAVAGRLPFTLDGVDDLRLAVDEAAAKLLSSPGEPQTLRLDLRPMPGRLELVVAADVGAAWPPDGLEQSLTWKVLQALAENVRFERWNGVPAIRIVKLTLGNWR